MKARFLSVVLTFLVLGPCASAHRLDEYLQATLISIEKDRVEASMRLVPGVAVSSVVLASVDSNADGIVSESEQQAYAQRVLRDVSLTIDGHDLKPKVISVNFPSVAEMKEGLGEIQIEFTAELPPGGINRKLVFENHHQEQISVYLVNCLVPSDRDIQITAQNRNEQQSFYQLDYSQDGSSRSTSGTSATVDRTGQTWFPGFVNMFRLGMRHIAEGTDHLLFLLALLLPAPLLAVDARWDGFAGVRHSFLQIMRVVTAFTVGHSITLAIAALGVFHLPSRPVEVLIAVSIFVSALHAFRPLFPGREAAIAAFFGLIHGLGFAATLGQLGLGLWERVGSILAFNLGIESMQLMVVAAVMPSLVFLSRTRRYSVVRIGGAMFAGFASIGWIFERMLNLNSFVDVIVSGVAHRAGWIAVALLLISLGCSLLHKNPDRQVSAVTH